jgi:hypothetical protein
VGTSIAWRRQLGVGVLLFAICGAATAIEPYQEYRKRIESTQNLTALKSDLFGDRCRNGISNISAHDDAVYTTPGQFEDFSDVRYRRYTGA